MITVNSNIIDTVSTNTQYQLEYPLISNLLDVSSMFFLSLYMVTTILF